MKLIDITGQKFNSLEVLERIPQTSPVQWKCRCDCGKIVNVRGSYLRNGHTKSCGCERIKAGHNQGSKNIKDLTGQKFGFLTVIKDSGERKNHNVVWICQCECGNTVVVSGDNLRRNHTKSCGCQKKESAQKRVIDLTGQRFGKLVVNRKTNNPYPSNRHTYWLCDCDCGQMEVLVDGENLKSGKISSCGCLGNSKGEAAIVDLLTKNQIPFIKEKTFDDCVYKDA